MATKSKNLVSFSGGLDSTATALLAVREYGSQAVRAVSIDYGQRHERELESAVAAAAWLGVDHEVVNVRGLLRRGPSLLEGDAVPHGHYAEDSMESTVVNGRNLLFVSALVAMCDPGDRVWLGVHGGDHFVYRDCRPEFTQPLSTALASAYEVALVTPFVHEDKASIVATYQRLDAAELAALTWSCYEGEDVHCGRCGTCVERAEAFSLAGLADPTCYADPHFWREAVSVSP